MLLSCWGGTSSRWRKEVQGKLERAAAVIVVMHGEDPSDEVATELNWAKRKGKQFFPISLEGGMFMELGIQHFDKLEPTQMPSAKFVAALEAHLA